jgi:hypothetical protein
VTFTDEPLAFTTELEYGGSYILQINIRNPLPWAGSNIYWDEVNQRPTFEPAGTPYNADCQRYQGVYFRWGLVGISPSALGPTTSNATRAEWNTSTVPGKGNGLYIPYYDSTTPENSVWITTMGQTWSSFLVSNSNNNPAPWCNDDTSSPTLGGTGKDYFGIMGENYSISSLYPNKVGDICRYLGHTNPGTHLVGYRLPTSEELLTGTPKSSPDPPHEMNTVLPYDEIFTKVIYQGNNNTWTATSMSALNDSTGKVLVRNGDNYANHTFFPASGGRDGYRLEGKLSGIGTDGNYISSTPRLHDYIGDGQIHSILITSAYRVTGNSYRYYAQNVRCIKDE